MITLSLIFLGLNKIDDAVWSKRAIAKAVWAFNEAKSMELKCLITCTLRNTEGYKRYGAATKEFLVI